MSSPDALPLARRGSFQMRMGGPADHGITSNLVQILFVLSFHLLGLSRKGAARLGASHLIAVHDNVYRSRCRRYLFA